MKALDNLKAAIAAFEKTQKKYAKLGAQDTESDGVFHCILKRAFLGRPPKIPGDPDGWELYSDEPGSLKAAAALSGSVLYCVRVLENLDKMPHGEAKELEKYLKSYCWRTDW